MALFKQMPTATTQTTVVTRQTGTSLKCEHRGRGPDADLCGGALGRWGGSAIGGGCVGLQR